MRIVDAFWEERNLGVTCYEIQMESSDKLEEVADELGGLTERQYMVAKIPSARYDLVQLFQKKGYSFIETAIKLEYNYAQIGIPNVPPRLRKICERCSWGVMNADELEQLGDEIGKGIFHTDRVYIDPYFTPQQAARRYELWIKDLIQQGHLPHKVSIDGKVFGFFLDKERTAHVYDGIIGGLYKEYMNTGLGYCWCYMGVISAQERKIKKCLTQVSSNNPDVLKLHTQFGASITGMEHVLVKHN